MSIPELRNAYSRVHHGKNAMDFADCFTSNYAFLISLHIPPWDSVKTFMKMRVDPMK
jgi:hypothetical protein